MPTHLGGDSEPTPLLAKGSPFGVSNDRKTSLLRDRPARRAVKRAYRIWVSDAAHHCVQLRIDLLFTMSDNLHRVIEDRRDTNSNAWTSSAGNLRGSKDWLANRSAAGAKVGGHARN